MVQLGMAIAWAKPVFPFQVNLTYTTPIVAPTCAPTAHFRYATPRLQGSGANRIGGAIRSGVRPGDAAYAAMT